MNTLSDKVIQLRKDYIQGELSEDAVEKDPFEQFAKWFDEALKADVNEANAMALGTVNAEGQPAVRIVLLRGFDQKGFVFYTNYESRKGRDMEENPRAALTFFWPELERQIRIEGAVEKTTPAESDQYFLTRPRNNRLGAWASPQSQVIEGREVLEDLVRSHEIEFADREVTRPEGWGGYRLRPSGIEFWQGRASRLHDRIRYRLGIQGWTIERLAP